MVKEDKTVRWQFILLFDSKDFCTFAQIFCAWKYFLYSPVLTATFHTDLIISLNIEYFSIYFFKPSLILPISQLQNNRSDPIRPLYVVTSVLVAQSRHRYIYGNSKIILTPDTQLDTTLASRLSGMISLPPQKLFPTLPTRVQTSPLTTWNMCECGGDRASNPGSNH